MCLQHFALTVFVLCPIHVIAGDICTVADLPAQHRTDQRHQVQFSFSTLCRLLASAMP